ncbi:MAG: Gfo/Idh/MocA family oxidoreductase [Alphaproteobacteria bacterium]
MSFRIGWIGCGRHATQMLLPQLGRHDVQLAAVCDRDPAAAGRVAATYGVGAAYGDWRALLAHPGLDGVFMAVGPELHGEAGIAALGRGLPVFMEKPPAANRAGAEAVAAAAERAGKPVVVGFMKRYATGNRIARTVIADPAFGPVLGVVGTYMTAPTYFAGAVDYNGFFLHHCVHYMDLMPWLAMSPIVEMSVRKAEPAPGRLLLHVGFACASGAIGTMVMGTIQSRGTPMEFVQVMGDHRRVEIDNVINVAYYRDPPFKADRADATLDPAADTLSWTPNFTAAANEDHKGYSALIAAAVAAMKGEPSDAPTIADGVAAMANLERMVAQV